jgi:cytochrome c553
MKFASRLRAPGAGDRSTRDPWSRAALRLGAAALLAVLAVAPAAAETTEEKAKLCDGCHGANGIPADKSWPVISGQQLGYLYLQLRDFKSGARKSDVMGPLIAALDRDEMMALAGYFSKQPWSDLRQPRAPATIAAQATTANTATGCTGCHQGAYQGEGTQPRLAEAPAATRRRASARHPLEAAENSAALSSTEVMPDFAVS